jgi:hypothetical protein
VESSWSSSRPPKCTSHLGFSLGLFTEGFAPVCDSALKGKQYQSRPRIPIGSVPCLDVQKYIGTTVLLNMIYGHASR